MMTKNERTPGSAIGAVWRNLGIASLVILFLAVCVIAAIAVCIPQNTADAVAQRGEVVLEASTGRVLYSDNMNAVTYPASTTKILTALVVLEHLPLSYKVEIPACAAGVEGSSIYLRKGEVLTVEDLLYGLMLRSGNDAAVALACAVAGNVESFADLMNARAKECGAENSHFVNPHGLHDDDHYTTAYDLALITAEAYGNDDFRRIAATRSVTVGEGESKRYFTNKNKLLTLFEGANGVKTGYTTKSGRCLVGGALRDGMQLVSVVLNRYDMWEETERILQKCFDEYRMRELPAMPFPGEGEGNLAVEVELDGEGNVHPSAYPVKKDGSEVPYLVPRR